MLLYVFLLIVVDTSDDDIDGLLLCSLLTVYMCFTITLRCWYRLEHAPNAELMAAFSREANNKLREFAPQNISNMLWAYATLGHSPGTLVALRSTPQCHLCFVVVSDAHAKLVMAGCQLFCPSSQAYHAPQSMPLYIYNVLLCIAGVPLLSAVMSAAMTQLKDFTPQAIKDTLWAFATLGFTPNNHFLQGSVDQCLVLIAQFNPQNIANAIWAFAKFGYHPGR